MSVCSALVPKNLALAIKRPRLSAVYFKDPQNKSDQNLLYFANLAAISEALNSSTVLKNCQNFCFSSPVLAILQLAATTSTERSLVFYTGFNPPEHKTKLFFANLLSHLQKNAQAQPQTTQRT